MSVNEFPLAFPIIFDQERGHECPDRTKDMVDSLPAPFPKEKDTNNYRLLCAAARLLEGVADDIDRVQVATQIRNAKTIDELQELAHIVNIVHNQGESLEAFRIRVLVAFNIIKSEGTIEELLQSAAFITGVDVRNISIEENIQPGVIQLTLPEQAVEAIEVSRDEVTSMLSQIIAAGYTLELIFDGTLRYTTPEDYAEGDYDPDRGKGTIEDGERTERGTYAGVM